MDEQKLRSILNELLDEKLEPIKKDMVTKSDLAAARKELTTKIEDTREELTAKIEDTRKELTAKIEDTREELNTKIENTKHDLKRKMDESQEDTIETLSEVIHTGYNLHEKRMKKVEEKLGMTDPHKN